MADVLCTLHIADLFRDRRMAIPTRLDYAKIRRYLDGEWPKATPRSVVVDGESKDAYWWIAHILTSGGTVTDYVVIDTEFNRDDKYLTLMGIGYPGMTAALQIRWPTLTSGDKAKTAEMVTALVQTHSVVFQNALADIPVIEKAMGIRYANYKRVDDTMLADAVLWSDWPHDLEFLASLYGSHPKMKHLSKSNFLLYNLGDVVDTIAVWEALRGQLEQDPKSKAIYEQQSLALIPLLLDAHARGIRVNSKRVVPALADYTERLEVAATLARAYTGIPDFNVGSAAQVGMWLYDIEGMPRQRKKGKGAQTVDEEAIAHLRQQVVPVPDLDDEREQGLSYPYIVDRIEKGAHPVLEARAFYAASQQVRSHYLAPCFFTTGRGPSKKFIAPRKRIYPSFKIHAQASGRWSTTEPPLAQLPADLR